MSKKPHIPEGQMIWDDEIVDIPTEFDEEELEVYEPTDDEELDKQQ